MRALVFAVVIVTACGAKGGGDATFKVFYPDPPAEGFKAKVGKQFFIKPVAQCVYGNGRDARWSMTGAKLATGKLPPGLTLEEGKISGTPVEAGTFPVVIEFDGVVCGGTKQTNQRVEITIVSQ
jgi:hypothetical protein